MPFLCAALPALGSGLLGSRVFEQTACVVMTLLAALCVGRGVFRHRRWWLLGLWAAGAGTALAVQWTAPPVCCAKERADWNEAWLMFAAGGFIACSHCLNLRFLRRCGCAACPAIHAVPGFSRGPQGINLTLFLALPGSMPASTHGQPHLDILVYQRDGALRLGAFDFGTSGVLESNRVFTTNLETAAGLPGAASSSNPGWNAVRNNFQLMRPGTQASPGESALAFNIIVPSFTGRNLSHWNGTGEVSFESVPSGEVLLYSKGSGLSGRIEIDGGTNSIPGYLIASTGPGGCVHRYLTFSLFGNASLNAASIDAPAPGVYLLAMEATVTRFAQPSPAFSGSVSDFLNHASTNNDTSIQH